MVPRALSIIAFFRGKESKSIRLSYPTLFSTKKEKDNLFPKKALLYNEGRE